MTTQLNFPQVLAATEKVVREIGEDYVHKGSCQYVDQKTFAPMCAVGHVLIEAGVPVTELARNSVMTDPYRLASRGVIKADERTLRFLKVLQRNQDARRPWGQSFRRARSEVQA